MRPADLDRILEIERRSFGEDAYDRNLFAEYLGRCGELSLVWERADRVEAYLIGCARAGERAELVSIAVDPRARERGVASALIKSLFRRLRARGVVRINLMVKHSNFAAQSLYSRHGFKKVRVAPGYYEDGSDGILMARFLADRTL
jgi:[ribosomal protein S18]-alanine N-acetyltransferase